MSAELCIICGEGGEKSKLITVKNGLGTIIHSSKLREDQIHIVLAGTTTATVHAECRKTYINPKYITLDRKRREAAREKINLRRVSDCLFNFKTNCFICGKIVPTDEQRVKHPERDPVSLVATLGIHDSIRSRASSRGDVWGDEVLVRTENVIDLVAAEGRYHRKCYSAFYSARLSALTPGKPQSSTRHEAFLKLCSFMEAEEDSQFDLQDLIDRLKMISPLTEPYSKTHLLRLLEGKYPGQIIFANQRGLKTIVCLKGTAAKVLNQAWYSEQRVADPLQERLRVVQAAGQIVREDIKAMVYDTSRYPTPDEIAAGGQDLVPETLQSFINTVACEGKKGDREVLKRKCLAVEHQLIQITRPRSFLSLVHFGLSVLLHKSFGSRFLIDIVNSLGHCSSYSEVSKFEAVVALTIKADIDQAAFIQFVFDNVDINVSTLDGHNTVHSMGGIQCVTPGTAVSLTKKHTKRKRRAAWSTRRGF